LHSFSSFFRLQRCNSGRQPDAARILQCKTVFLYNLLMHAAVTLALAALLLCVPRAHADDFYQGKTLTIVVGYTVGGGYDINARLVARHIGKYIPGSPNVV